MTKSIKRKSTVVFFKVKMKNKLKIAWNLRVKLLNSPMNVQLQIFMCMTLGESF